MFGGKLKLEDCIERAPKPTINIEHSLLIIKPDAMEKADEIEDIILKSGFTIINVRVLLLLFVVLFTSNYLKYSLSYKQWRRSCRGSIEFRPIPFRPIPSPNHNP